MKMKFETKLTMYIQHKHTVCKNKVRFKLSIAYSQFSLILLFQCHEINFTFHS